MDSARERSFLRWRMDDLVDNGPVTSGIMIVHIDVLDVRFDDLYPVGWTNTTDVTVGITASDQNGSGVDLGSHLVQAVVGWAILVL